MNSPFARETVVRSADAGIHHGRRLTTLLERAGIALAFGVVLVAASVASPSFLTTTNLLNVLRQISILGVLSVGMTFVILTGGIDLSVGSIVALAGVVAATLQPSGPVAAVIGGLVAGAAAGLVNGMGVAFGRLPPFIMTLGMMTMARGIAFMYTGGVPIRGITSEFMEIGNAYVGRVPIPVIYLLAVFAAAYFVLRYTVFGRMVYAVGSNEEAAWMSGIPVGLVKVYVYTLSGALAGFGGIIYTSQLGIGTPIAGQGYELTAIAAVVVGGAAVTGGEGSVLGTFIGAAIIGVIGNIMNLTGVNPFVQQFLMGVIIVGTVLLRRGR